MAAQSVAAAEWVSVERDRAAVCQVALESSGQDVIHLAVYTSAATEVQSHAALSRFALPMIERSSSITTSLRG